MNAIDVRRLTKNFGNNTALAGIDFSVPTGSISGFLGPNGAGKTTTIKILLGLISKSTGTVRVLGENVSTQKDITFKKRIAYLPQDPVFPSGLNGKEVLQFVAGTYGLDRREASDRIDQLLDQFQLKDASTRRIESYSRGMKQRLGLAAVLLPRPELMILDEPVSALDPEGRYEVLNLISTMRGKATVFFSSHILSDVERICDRVILIDRGKKLAESSLNDLVKRYSTEQYILKVPTESMDAAYALIAKSASVKEVERSEDLFRITAHHGRLNELRKSVIPAMVNAGIMVLEFSLVTRDLESIFLDITTNGSGRTNHENGNH